jgi:hypothetical protein
MPMPMPMPMPDEGFKAEGKPKLALEPKIPEPMANGKPAWDPEALHIKANKHHSSLYIRVKKHIMQSNTLHHSLRSQVTVSYIYIFGVNLNFFFTYCTNHGTDSG